MRLSIWSPSLDIHTDESKEQDFSQEWHNFFKNAYRWFLTKNNVAWEIRVPLCCFKTAHVAGTVGALFILACKETKFEGLTMYVSRTGHTEAYSIKPHFHKQ